MGGRAMARRLRSLAVLAGEGISDLLAASARFLVSAAIGASGLLYLVLNRLPIGASLVLLGAGFIAQHWGKTSTLRRVGAWSAGFAAVNLICLIFVGLDVLAFADRVAAIFRLSV